MSTEQYYYIGTGLFIFLLIGLVTLALIRWRWKGYEDIYEMVRQKTESDWHRVKLSLKEAKEAKRYLEEDGDFSACVLEETKVVDELLWYGEQAPGGTEQYYTTKTVGTGKYKLHISRR